MLGRSKATVAPISRSRLFQTATLHFDVASVAVRKIGSASVINARASARAFASTVRIEDTVHDPPMDKSKTRFFRPVEKQDNGVAIIRCEGFDSRVF